MAFPQGAKRYTTVLTSQPWETPPCHDCRDSLPKYRKHRATGQAVVTLSGRDFYLGPHGTKASRREYDRLIGEWLAAGRQPLHVSPEQLSVAELCVGYLKYAHARYVKNGRPTSEQSAIRAALRFVRANYSRQPAAEFGPLALKAVRNSMIAADLAITTINQHVGRIRRMFRWGVAEELIRPEVYQALVALPGLRKGRGEARETKPVLPVDDATVDATLPHLPEVVADMVRLQRVTGMRPAEVCIHAALRHRSQCRSVVLCARVAQVRAFRTGASHLPRTKSARSPFAIFGSGHPSELLSASRQRT